MTATDHLPFTLDPARTRKLPVLDCLDVDLFTGLYLEVGAVRAEVGLRSYSHGLHSTRRYTW